MAIEQLTEEQNFQELYARKLVERFHGREKAFDDALYTAFIRYGHNALDAGNIDVACEMRRLADDEHLRRDKSRKSTLDDVYSGMFSTLHRRIIEKQTEKIVYRH